MMCMCVKEKQVNPIMMNRKTQLPVNFQRHQMEQLRKKFNKVAGNKSVIDRQTFLKNMGILGMHSVQAFSDRLFNSFDLDNDLEISFQDFVQYMAILKCGTDHEKALISFKLIDYKNKSKINENDFKQFLQDFFISWSSLTNLPITYQIRERMDTYVKIIFDKVKKKTGSVIIDFKFYSEELYNKDRQFMEAFQFITRGVGGIFLSENRPITKSNDYERLQLGRQILVIINEMEKIYETVFYKQLLNQKQLDDANKQLEIVFQQQYPALVPTINYKKLRNKKMDKASKRYDSYQFIHTIDNHINSTYDTKNRQTKGNTTQFKSIKAILQQINQEEKEHQSQQNRVNKEKLEYLKIKLAKLLEQTSTIKKDLNEQFKTHDYSPSIFSHQNPNVHYPNIKNNNGEGSAQKREGNKRKFSKTKDLFQVRVTQGNMIFIGDQNWNLVLNMMIGIQMAVRSVNGYTEMLYEQPKDFNLRYYFQLIPRRFGGDEAKNIYSFTDYAPNTFNHIRKIFDIDNEEYINSIGPNRLMTSLMLGQMSSMAELTSQGKSGSFFYYTADGKYMLKTIKQKQYRFLRSILKDYFFHLKNNPKSLITKFYGLHKLSQKNQTGQFINKCYFVIMANVFNTHEKICQRYDIKGSTYGRQNKDPHPNATRKDLDFLKRGPISVSAQQRQQLINNLRVDAQFFQQHNIIDYSLLIGVITSPNSEQSKCKQISLKKETSGFSGNLRDTIFIEGNKEKYLFGVIDILTQYDSRKVMEYWFKKILYGQGISAVPPQAYAKRFINFIEDQVFERQLIMVEKIPRTSTMKLKQQSKISNSNNLY